MECIIDYYIYVLCIIHICTKYLVPIFKAMKIVPEKFWPTGNLKTF